jgi:hypothetical protein
MMAAFSSTRARESKAKHTATAMMSCPLFRQCVCILWMMLRLQVPGQRCPFLSFPVREGPHSSFSAYKKKLIGNW